MKKQKIKVAVSGGFDPVHVGHLRMFQEAKKLGDHLTVILNSDKFLNEKKQYNFMNYKERKEIILGFDCVDEVIKSVDSDQTVRKTLISLAKEKKIDIFANGGDRKNEDDLPEKEICLENNIQMIFGIGGGKVQSSSKLIEPFLNPKEKKPWGYFENLIIENNYLIKRLVIYPNSSLSLQYHNNRDENWTILKGKGRFTIEDKQYIEGAGYSFKIKKLQKHRIENLEKEDLIILEIQSGDDLSEEDIVRLDDEYGRI
jgi:D-beta-D-heptose 7-phosphate kinase/D-beta-D-heptose 1-phosphate adenosyltransferase